MADFIYDILISAPQAALQFLTIVPAISRKAFKPKDLSNSTAYYPLIGALIGISLLVVNFVLEDYLPISIRSTIILALWVGISGAIHLDGFLDSCDGIFGGTTPERRLEIMHDEHIGAYALSGGILLLLLKFTLLGSLLQDYPPYYLILAPALGRWGMTFAIFGYKYARPRGLGRRIKDNMHWQQFTVSTISALLIGVITAGWIGLVCFGVAGLLTFIVAHFTMRRIHGLTGDVYGAINELTELATLLTYLLLFSAFS